MMAEGNATLSSTDQGTKIVYPRENLVAGVAGEVSNTDGLSEQVVKQVTGLEMMDVDTDSDAILSTMEEKVSAIGDKSHDIATDKDRESIDRHVQSCKMVIEGLRKLFESEQSLKDNCRIIAWSQDLDILEKKLQFPETKIAIVGDTGVGKSSLLNAILGLQSVLPTSGIRACTAVVVEVIQNTTNNNYEADIEFLKKEEWLEELKVLTEDLEAQAENKNNKNPKPDPNSDAYASYCKLMAVYGRTGTFEVLSRIDSCDIVTNLLGTTKIVSCETHEAFGRKIEKYIETQEPRSGGQYWPIVKRVSLRIPECDVCSSGAVLVDLPGIRDSNAARDKIASEYLQNCTAVWIVSSIHRAIDDKTAKNLLGESFKRQLLMDGLYGSIAFVCTKTDDLKPSEIIKSLRLKEKMKPYQDKVNEMIKKQNELESKETQSDREEREIMKLTKSIGVERRAMNVICAKARNDYSRCEIKRNFKEGRKEMMGRADFPNEEEEEEDPMDDDDTEDDGNGSSDGNLKVFCCSSTEYQKLQDPFAEDGPAQVFDNIEATEIPDVRRYVHEITSIRRRKGLEMLIRGLGRFVFDIQRYLEGNFLDPHNRSGSESLINSQLTKFKKNTRNILKNLSKKIDGVFENSIRPKLEQGAKKGRDEALGICVKWGAPKNTKMESDKKGGLSWSTYSFTTRHHGKFHSPTYGMVNFNEDLSEPMLRELTVCWVKAFSQTLYQILDETQQRVLEELRDHTADLRGRLEKCGLAQKQLSRKFAWCRVSASYTMEDMDSKLKEQITEQQRKISRQITPQIQVAMNPTYAACSEQSGKGMFGRMKNIMETDVYSRRNTMYDKAKKSIMRALRKVKAMIIKEVRVSCQTVIERLKKDLESLWSNSEDIRAALVEPINTISRDVRQLYTDARLEEYIEDLHPGHEEPAVDTAGPSTTTSFS